MQWQDSRPKAEAVYSWFAFDFMSFACLQDDDLDARDEQEQDAASNANKHISSTPVRRIRWILRGLEPCRTACTSWRASSRNAMMSARRLSFAIEGIDFSFACIRLGRWYTVYEYT